MKKINILLGLSLFSLSIPLIAQENDKIHSEEKSTHFAEQAKSDFDDILTKNKNEDSLDIEYSLHKKGTKVVNGSRSITKPFLVTQVKNTVGEAKKESNGSTSLSPETFKHSILFYVDKDKLNANVYNEDGKIYETEFKAQSNDNQSRLFGDYKISVDIK